MRLEILLNLGSDWPPYMQGDVVEVSEEMGRRMLREGVAREVAVAEIALDERTESKQPPGDELPAADKKTKSRTQKQGT